MGRSRRRIATCRASTTPTKTPIPVRDGWLIRLQWTLVCCLCVLLQPVIRIPCITPTCDLVQTNDCHSRNPDLVYDH